MKAFLDLGCFAIGIDLNPEKENRYVFRAFPRFAIRSPISRLVYTNSSITRSITIESRERSLKSLDRMATMLKGARSQQCVTRDSSTASWINVDELIGVLTAGQSARALPALLPESDLFQPTRDRKRIQQPAVRFSLLASFRALLGMTPAFLQ